MAKLFKNKIIKQKLEVFRVDNFEEKLKIVQKWHSDYHTGTLKDDKEISRAPGWTQDFLGKILEYTTKPDENYTYEVEPSIAGQRPDFMLGHFNTTQKNYIIGELKDAKTSLDAPQKREGSLTPIQQAFKYKGNLRDSSFVIVSNFFETRLYYDNYLDYEMWTLDTLINPKNDYFELRKFIYLLGESNLIAKRGESNTKGLISFIQTQQKEITKGFYKDYSLLRKELFKDIIVQAKKIGKPFKQDQLDLVLAKTQKIIDRIIFIHFCEDLDLLPQGKLSETVQYAENMPGLKVWQVLIGFFEAVNSGSEKLNIPDGYNGGLFHKDVELETLTVGDKICKKFVDLGEYDFEDDLSVNILGHIFEQSISDIEELKDKIQKNEEVALSKRKKDGVFYTPEYIVDYIVKNSVGKKIEDWEEELRIKHNLLDTRLGDKTYKKKAILVYSELQEKLQNITVLDPACGSGAFLVNVFDFLLSKNIEISKTLDDLGVNQGLFSSEVHFKSILQNSIYGVDLNEESVEISKLSLWLKTAIKGKKLANLDSNIKCGNSLIDDSAIAGEKAFSWESEFPQIFKDGGFDVIVGNPPYGAKLDKSSQDFLNKRYIKGASETAISFIKLSKDILSEKGYLSFIIPKSFSYASNYKSIREYLFDDIFEVVDCKKVWKEVKLEQVIFSISKGLISSSYETKVLKGSNIELLGNIDKRYVNLFGFYLNGIDKKELKVGEKLFGQQFFLNDVSQNSRGGIFQKHISNDGEIGVLGGADIQRNGIVGLKGHIHKKYIEGDEKCFISENSLLVQNIIAHVENPTDHIKITACIPDTYDFCIVDTINQLKFNEGYINKVFWLFLNSKVLNWYCYRFIFGKAIRTMHFDNAVTSRIPIPKDFNQTPFIEKADFMLENNKLMGEKVQKFLKRLQGTFEIEKLSKKLLNFYELSFEEFVKELKKKKIVLSLKDQDEWEEYFDSYKIEIVALKTKLDECDKEIDEMVFDLYGLTSEEREVVMGS